MNLVKDLDEDHNAQQAMCCELGYEDYWHYRRVFWTFSKHHGECSGPRVRDHSLYDGKTGGLIVVGMAMSNWWKSDRALGQNPHLLEPIEGMSVDRWAKIHTVKNHEPTTPLFELLARFELDVATWDRVDKTWSDRLHCCWAPLKWRSSGPNAHERLAI